MPSTWPATTSSPACPTARVFLDRVRQALARLSRNPGAVGVLFLDIDNFKFVNDSHGHPVGDDLLRAVPAAAGRGPAPRRHARPFRRRRVRGAVHRRSRDPDEAATVAQRVLNGFRRPFTAGTEEIA